MENIRAILNPSISEVASVCKASRQAVYKWLSGDSEPEAEKLSRIKALSKIADAFKKANISRADNLLRMKAFNGFSLLDMVANDKDWHEAVDLLIAESKAMELNYKKSGLSESKAKPNDDWQTYLSIPSMREDE